MSTPTGRPFYPVSVSDYAPKKVRERAASESEPVASGAADRSSESPKTPRQQPTEAHPADDPEDQHEAPLAPTGPHERPVNEPDDPNPPLPFRPRGAREDAARPDSADDQYARDLDRLEANLNQIRRQGVDDMQESATRLPRASQLPPVAGLRPPASGRDNYIDGFRLPRSLGPTYVPPPPLREKGNYLAAGSPPSKSDRGPKLSSAGTRPADLPPMPAVSPAVATQTLPAQASPQPVAPQPALAPAPQAPAAQMQASQPLVRPTDMRPDTAAPPSQGAPAGVSIASVIPAAPPAASKPVRPADAEAVKLLLTQGEQFVNAGDLVTARLLFRRAVEAGDAEGALALGATYDPGVLAKLGVRGIAADIEQARGWYEKARDLGSAEASRRLRILANR